VLREASSLYGEYKDVARSRVTEDRLTSLALMHVHRDILVDVDKVIARIAKGKHHSIEFIILSSFI